MQPIFISKKTMAYLAQHSWLSSSSLTKISTIIPSTKQPKPSHFISLKPSFALNQSNSHEDSSPPEPPPGPVVADSVKLAFERAKAYRKTKSEKNPVGNGDQKSSAPVSVSFSSSRDGGYEANTEVKVPLVIEGESESSTGVKQDTNFTNGVVEEKVKKKKKQQINVSSIDFVGLGFSDKKQSRGLPPGLVPIADPFPEGDFPEVEIIIGDMNNFERPTASKPDQEENPDSYKPRVSTWGVFPRPSNISKTFGGGRTIRPGDILETAEDKAAKEEKTRQLIAAYNEKIGLKVDPKLKFECEQALKEGNSLMDSGKLKEAMPYYEQVIDKMVFKSELHGLAALQWSICQDSLNRHNEARIMYEKLQSHPNPKVSKQAKRFVFSFQAMEMMKVKNSELSSMNTAGYQNYFEAFIEKDKIDYTKKEIEDEKEDVTLNQAVPYLIFLASPIFLVLYIALHKLYVN